jgi:aspartyl-tRNA(Asn)/glutamyl-tRNA(Gln) amidotransferase subunit B
MTFWFSKTPHEICKDLGISIEYRRARELENLFDGNINGWYYLSAATPNGSDEAAKWILGALAAKLNELKKNFSYASALLPADYMASFITYLKDGRFERGFSKDVFAELMKGHQFREIVLRDDMTPDEVQEWADLGGDCLLRMSGNEVMDLIISMPKFKAASGNEIDEIIEAVIASNAEQAAKVPDNPKLLQWFIGQVMKASKGKASATTVQEKLRKKFGISE